MDCCEKLTPDFTGEPEVAGAIGRRTALKRLTGLAGGIMFVSKRNAYGQGVKYCWRSAASCFASFPMKSLGRADILPTKASTCA